MNYWRFFCTLTVIWGLIACQSEATPPPTPAAATPIPTATNEPVIPTVAPTNPPATNTPLPTPAAATPLPTAEPPTATAVPPTPTIPPSAPVNSVQVEEITRGFEEPIGGAHAGDDRLFVIEKGGVIKILQNGEILATPFADLRSVLSSEAYEQGLLGLAFHPRYAENGYFYVYYTNFNGDTVVARYNVSAADPNQADPNSSKVLLTVPQPYGNHNGGQIEFGPDGYLYIALGDGGSAGDPENNGQNLESLLGKILRLDVDNGDPYAIPADNPFVGQANARPEIWAWGLRNPWRFSFDRLTGDLFIADVGQNQWEEVNFQPAGSPGGENYGWRVYEGNHCYDGLCAGENFVYPIAEYSHAEGHCSITGGYMYRGTQHPTLYGNYFFIDYCSGTIWRLFPAGDGSWEMAEVASQRLLIASFAEDANGEIYLLNQSNGAIYRLIP